MADIGAFYKGEESIAILKNHGRHMFISGASPKELDEELSLYAESKKSLIKRYDGVNDKAIPLIVGVVVDFNSGKEVSHEKLEKLLADPPVA
mgnify:CR=1 FL=1